MYAKQSNQFYKNCCVMLVLMWNTSYRLEVDKGELTAAHNEFENLSF